MGVQAVSSSLIRAMAPMKAMKKAGPVMSKGGLAQAIADELEMKKKDVTTVLDSLASVAATEVKTRLKPATKAGKREIFGKVVVVKAKPAKTVVKAFAVAALKKSVGARLRLHRQSVGRL